MRRLLRHIKDFVDRIISCDKYKKGKIYNLSMPKFKTKRVIFITSYGKRITFTVRVRQRKKKYAYS